MTAVPNPPNPTLRCRLIFQQADADLGGNRFFLTFGGASPSGANCIAIADGISTAWGSHIAPLVNNQWHLTEVDVLDITTETGLSGQWQGSIGGGLSGIQMVAQVATNVEFDISRRYRGGKPRIFWPPPDSSALLDSGHWTPAFVTAMSAATAAFFTDVEALNVGAVGTLHHINLSYYAGFKNITNSSGRERAVPQYRTVPLQDTIVGYACKAVMGSQKRRRTATTP